MRNKIIWITFWTTISLWLGGLMTGCAGSGQRNENYKVLEEDRPMFSTEPSEGPHVGANGQGPMIEKPPVKEASPPEPAPQKSTQPGSANDAAQPAALSVAAALPADIVITSTTQAAEIRNPKSEIRNNAGTIIDRRDWPRITLSPYSGKVGHQPVYFHDVRLGNADDLQPFTGDTVSQFNAALTGHEPENWSADNALAVPLQPLKFAFDLVALPVRMIIDPPWETIESP
ncbi:MAG: hypothetical protein WD042_16445 [Phycisphaeraceae bacterium]